ncbi:hypothetical protein SeMB42_g05310 [Synchytrium endobioticum]|uniref:sphingolipid C(9)-methyltransferase n=1 Tax=Synchytrium endobioticum TaxID=286115 RepID=A0A507CSA9_9FUNG|nr:hypothetical protein SeMB42_g05310 [Synchytrium endobioticum]
MSKRGHRTLTPYADPRRPEAKTPFVMPTSSGPDDDDDPFAGLGIIVGMVALMMRLKWMSWIAMFMSLSSYFNEKTTQSDSKYGVGGLGFAALGLAINYVYYIAAMVSPPATKMGPVPERLLKQTVALPPYPVEGAGSQHFSSYGLLGAVLGVPAILVYLLHLPWSWFIFLAVLTALPIFAGYNIIYAQLGDPIRPQTGLPGKPIEEYLDIKDSDLAATYTGRVKIPMETFFESYFDQKINIRGDMLDLLEVRHDWAAFQFQWGQVKFFLTQWIPETLWHSRKQDENQVRDHYDRGDDFYEAFLGPMMVYTSGIVTDTKGRETLEELQTNKLNLICDKLRLTNQDKFLDIGCGWGTLAIHASKKTGCDATGVTIGRNQTAYATQKAADASVGDNVKFWCMDYRDIPRSNKFTKIAAVEMAEHVGVLRFQTFLRQVRELLEDDGMFFMQVAGLRRFWQYEDFIWGLFMAKYVFPGADASTPLNWYINQCETAGFEVLSVDTVGVHYSATLMRWYVNWLNNKDTIIAKYGVRWWRIWEFFLAYSTIIARQGSATCYQITMHKNLNMVDRSKFISRRLIA